MVADRDEDNLADDSNAAENIMDAESEEEIVLQKEKLRDSSHRNQVSSTNSNFYKFSSGQESLT